ncbi:hypothetical protein AB0K60_31120 [Thermopolyspora sp. NPDC052614]|uniref:hypothetical protein n=1 Tax=Thermopolyspora sp. NPDC052614 TaxID=3155682 RepID=UPI0034448CF8
MDKADRMQPDTWRSDLVPECDVWQDESGRWHGVHRASGEAFEAHTFRVLEVVALVKRTLRMWERAR